MNANRIYRRAQWLVLAIGLTLSSVLVPPSAVAAELGKPSRSILAGYVGKMLINAPIYVMRADAAQRSEKDTKAETGVKFIRYSNYREAFAALQDGSTDFLAMLPLGLVRRLVRDESQLGELAVVGGMLGKAPYYRVSVIKISPKGETQQVKRFGISRYNSELDRYLKNKDKKLRSAVISERFVDGSIDKMTSLYTGFLDHAFVLSEIAHFFLDEDIGMTQPRGRRISVNKSEFEDFPFAVLLTKSDLTTVDQNDKIARFLTAYREAVAKIYDPHALKRIVELISEETKLPYNTIYEVMTDYISQKIFEREAKLTCSDAERLYGINIVQATELTAESSGLQVFSGTCR